MSNVGKIFRIVQTKTKLFQIIKKVPPSTVRMSVKKNGDVSPHLHCHPIILFFRSCPLISYGHIRVFRSRKSKLYRSEFLRPNI